MPCKTGLSFPLSYWVCVIQAVIISWAKWTVAWTATPWCRIITRFTQDCFYFVKKQKESVDISLLQLVCSSQSLKSKDTNLNCHTSQRAAPRSLYKPWQAALAWACRTCKYMSSPGFCHWATCWLDLHITYTPIQHLRMQNSSVCSQK